MTPPHEEWMNDHANPKEETLEEEMARMKGDDYNGPYEESEVDEKIYQDKGYGG